MSYVFFNNNPHLYKVQKPEIEPIKEVTIDRYNGSELYRLISGKNAVDVWNVINEAMELVKVAQPDIYNAVVSRLIKL